MNAGSVTDWISALSASVAAGAAVHSARQGSFKKTLDCKIF